MVRLLSAAAPLVVAAALAAPAAAATFCVHQGTGCPAGAVDEGADLQEALDDAAAAAGPDQVTIGSGTYTGPFDYTHPSPVSIVGAGAGATTLDAADDAASHDRVLAAGGADVSRLTVRIPVIQGWAGIAVGESAVVRDVAVAAKVLDPLSDDAVAGVILDGDAGLRSSAVDVAGGTAVALRGGEHSVMDSTLSGGAALLATPSAPVASVVRRSSLTGARPVVVQDAELVIENSVLRATGADSRGLTARCGLGPTASVITADHVTLLGPGNGMGILAHCVSAGETTLLTVTNSIVRGFAQAFTREAKNGGTAVVEAAYSDLENVAASTQLGPDPAALSSVVDVDPLLAADGYRLRTGSPLIDAGAPGPAAQIIDFGHGARRFGAAQDIGADEYDPANPPPDPAPGTPPGGQAPPAFGAPLALAAEARR
ncbi:MAG TPA: hypothetical protein VGW10_13295, partial [Solirubrobacteraceae bacterium]|nr:hypothetical protein [Solirubrobacteraceae bacterium]